MSSFGADHIRTTHWAGAVDPQPRVDARHVESVQRRARQGSVLIPCNELLSTDRTIVGLADTFCSFELLSRVESQYLQLINKLLRSSSLGAEYPPHQQHTRQAHTERRKKGEMAKVGDVEDDDLHHRPVVHSRGSGFTRS